MPLVRYIGRKDRKADNVANSATVWAGNGDVQDVPAEVWDKLQKHPDVWELAGDSKPAGNKTLADADAAPDLNAMDRDALFTLATKRGLTPHHKAGKAKLIEMLEA